MKTLLAPLALVALGAVGLAAVQDGKKDSAGSQETAQKDAPKGDAAVVRAQLPSYPLDTCVVSGEPLGSMGDPVDQVHDGKLVRFCCEGCPDQFAKDPAKYTKKIDEAVVAAQKPIYPLETCVVSSEPLGSMGDPVEMVDGTRLVRLCCDGCKKMYAKDPAKFLAKVDQAMIEDQRASYPLETCVVSGEPLTAMGEPFDHLYGVTLVRFCCEGCTKEFAKEPSAYVSKVEKARAKSGKAVEGSSKQG